MTQIFVGKMGIKVVYVSMCVRVVNCVHVFVALTETLRELLGLVEPGNQSINQSIYIAQRHNVSNAL